MSLASLYGVIDIVHGNQNTVDIKIQSGIVQYIRTYNLLCKDGCEIGKEIVVQCFDFFELICDKNEPWNVIGWTECFAPSSPKFI